MKNYRQLRSEVSRRNHLPQERAQPVVYLYQMLCPKTIHLNNIIHTEQVILRNVSVYTYMHLIKINGKRDEFEPEQGGHMGGLKG